MLRKYKERFSRKIQRVIFLSCLSLPSFFGCKMIPLTPNQVHQLSAHAHALPLTAPTAPNQHCTSLPTLNNNNKKKTSQPCISKKGQA